MKSLPLVALALLSGCRPAAPTAPTVEPPDPVNWRALVRDRQTVAAYAGRSVRFRLDTQDCAFEGRTIRVWYAERNTAPPVLIIIAAEPVTGSGPYVVTGTCGPAVADGIRRSTHIDYSVTITDARVESARAISP